MKPSRFQRRKIDNYNAGPFLMRTLIRHIIGAISAAVAGYLTTNSGMEVEPSALTGIMLAVYAVVEKSLKRVTGES